MGCPNLGRPPLRRLQHLLLLDLRLLHDRPLSLCGNILRVLLIRGMRVCMHEFVFPDIGGCVS
jgi:hypothetical protein